MEVFDWEVKVVFDYGCGIGILVILVGMLGVVEIDVVDIEKLVYESIVENVRCNGVFYFKVYFGNFFKVLEWIYDIILVNINRNVILNFFEMLYECLNVGG